MDYILIKPFNATVMSDESCDIEEVIISSLLELSLLFPTLGQRVVVSQITIAWARNRTVQNQTNQNKPELLLLLFAFKEPGFDWNETILLWDYLRNNLKLSYEKLEQNWIGRIFPFSPFSFRVQWEISLTEGCAQMCRDTPTFMIIRDNCCEQKSVGNT